MTNQPDLPLTFRAEVLEPLLTRLQAGECCSLVGTSGVGKSNLVRFLQRADVQAHYWAGPPPWIVLIDAHGLVFGEWPAEYMVLEFIIHRLLMEAERQELSAEIVRWGDDLHQRLVASPSTHLALRYLERICARLCQSQPRQIILVFDQFEDLWQTLAARFFLNLRHLRDQFKYQLVYLTVTRQRLVSLRDDLAAVEAFWELFATHTYGLGMYSEADARLMLARLEARQGARCSTEQEEAMLHLSGHHPGLLRAVFWAGGSISMSAHSLADLLFQAPVEEECTKLWNDLALAEQQALRSITNAAAVGPHDAVLADLRLKGLVQGEPPRLFSPLFALYVQRQTSSSPVGIVVNQRLRQVWVDGQLLRESLSRLEFDLLAYLAQHVGSICKREDILHSLYKEKHLEANDQRIDTVLRRLRDAVGSAGEHYLVTHRGVGIQLTDGGTQA